MKPSRYPVLPTDARADEQERALLARWKEEDLFHATQRLTAGGEPFVFYEGPPTANGRPGIHHVFARTIKDLVCRFRAMQGRQVTRIAGWDTHGLPVEIEVEKQLGITGKTEIGDHPGAKVSVAEFNRLCRESVWKYKSEWETLSDRIGYWLDYDHPYVTYANEYVESVWWLLRQLYDKGLLERGHKVLPYCPRCGTALSSHELALGYDTAKDPSVYVLYPLVGEEERYLLIWTTTPWTLAANFAVAVHPDLPYVEVDFRGRRVIVAEARAPHVAPGGENQPLASYRVVARWQGKDLVGLRYRRPLDIVAEPVGAATQVVVPGEFVTAEDGTGLVHMAPFGADDYAVARAHGLAFDVPVDLAGRFAGTNWDAVEGVFVKEADAAIMQRLKEQGHLFRRETVEHTYPFCWRCDTPLLYYPRASWFVRTTAIRDRLIALNAHVGWHPPEIGSGRFGEWLANNVDWALSRDRFWGTPLPVWVCDDDAEHVEVIGGYAELAARLGRPLPADFDPHKPHIDGYSFPCTRCGATMRRVPEVIDTWFDSGAMPVAQWHYPFEHRAEFEAHFPADFIAEGVEQTRGWFYSLLAIAAAVFDGPAYRNVVVNELVLDAEGRKMSKSRGNVVAPATVIERFGADAVRLHFLASSQVWLPKRFDEAAIADLSGGVFEKLRHTYNLFQLYAEDWRRDPGADGAPPLTDRPLADRWLHARLTATIRTVAEAWDAYDVTAGTRAIIAFVVDDLSNWWVRQNRGRFWVPGGSADPAALATLHDVLAITTRLLAPAAPFLADAIHRALTGTSAHLAPFPRPAPGHEDAALERAMDAVRRLASLARSAREDVGIRVRQPLARLLAAIPGDVDRTVFASLVPLLAAEVNVKQVELVDAGTDLVSLEARPSFRALGKRFGKATPAAADAIRALASEQVARFEAGEAVEIVVEGRAARLAPDDLVVHRQARGDVVVRADGVVVAALDPALTDELRQEGVAREVVSRVQRLRRDAGYRVADRIELWVSGDAGVRAAVERHAGYIAGETLALAVRTAGPEGPVDAAVDVELDGLGARLAVRRTGDRN